MGRLHAALPRLWSGAELGREARGAGANAAREHRDGPPLLDVGTANTLEKEKAEQFVSAGRLPARRSL